MLKKYSVKGIIILRGSNSEVNMDEIIMAHNPIQAESIVLGLAAKLSSRVPWKELPKVKLLEENDARDS